MARIEATATGTVCEVLPNGHYKVELHGSEKEVIGYLAGKMNLHHIKVLVGDHVSIILDPYGGKATNRITRRL